MIGDTLVPLSGRFVGVEGGSSLGVVDWEAMGVERLLLRPFGAGDIKSVGDNFLRMAFVSKR